MSNGPNHDINIGNALRVAPLYNAAAVAIIGAIDRISHDTLFGFTDPWIISFIYTLIQKSEIHAVTITAYCNIIILG